MMLALFTLDERTKKVILVLCALFIILLLITGGIYLIISKYMAKQSKNLDAYMYDLIKYKIVTNPTQFKKAMIYNESRLVFNSAKWGFRFIFVLTGLAIAISFLAFKGDLKGFFSEFFKLFPHIKWTTIGEINEKLPEGVDKIPGFSKLPVSVLPNLISKNPDFSNPLLYLSTIYYTLVFVCAFSLFKAVLAFIARIRRGYSISVEVFKKDLDKIDPNVNTFANMYNSQIPNQQQYQGFSQVPQNNQPQHQETPLNQQQYEQAKDDHQTINNNYGQEDGNQL